MDQHERMERACEREEEAAQEEFAAGLIDAKQLNGRIRDIQRDYLLGLRRPDVIVGFDTPQEAGK